MGFLPRLRFALVLAAGIVVGGCTTYDSPFVHKSEKELDLMEARDAFAARQFAKGRYNSARVIAEKLSEEPTVSRPLYQLEQVSALLMLGKREEAHELMMSVRNDIEMLFDRESEERAVSLWHGENNKVFRGDNHERAILYAFLAMSFIERGEWEDALRSVKNGLLADSSTDPENSYSSDFKLLSYLGYVAAKHMGDEGVAEEYKRELGDVRLDDEAADANAFLVIWSGTPPGFVRGGEYEEVRQIVPGGDVLSMITVEGSNGVQSAPRKLADVNFQASTRGGREMDTVVANKALVKSGMSASGNILLVAGFACLAATAGNSDANTVIALGSIGAACITLGLTFHVVGYCINSTADARYWKNLPGNFSIVPLRLPPGSTTVTVRGYYGWDNVMREDYRFNLKEGGVSVGHVSLIPYAESVKAPLEMYTRQKNLCASREAADSGNWSRYEVTE